MSCMYYTFKDKLFGGDFWCKKEDCSVDDKHYYSYCKGYNYRNCDIYNPKNSSSKNSSPDCFITTVVHDILGKKDDDKLLNNLRRFRDNILQKDKKYAELLQDYDNIGPIIADCIWCDKDAEQMANGIYDIALVPISQMIENKEYDKACEKYYLLTLSLINYYGLKHKYNHDKDLGLYEKDFDINKSGHGKRLVKNV